MAKKFDEILREDIGLSEDVRESLTSLWTEKISEAREEVAATLREEFARKFEHDKVVFAESIDRFLTDKIRAELEDFAIDKRAVVAERVAYKSKLKEHAKLLNKFIVGQLTNEMKEFRTEKSQMRENFGKLENFVLGQLAEEIQDFRKDKRALVDQKVKMVAEGKRKLAETRAQFVKRAATIVESNIERTLRSEITQFKDDIRIARENEFGREMFECFAPMFMASHLNEGTELRKTQRMLESRNQELVKMQTEVANSKNLMEKMNSRLRATQDLVERQKVMSELMSPLPKDKRTVMKDLLESVNTKGLQAAYNKYLPSVLNTDARPAQRGILSESTGNRVTNAQPGGESEMTDLQRMIALAGIKH